MRKIFLLFFAGNSFLCIAQKDSTPIAPYLKSRQLPAFNILQMDSISYFSKYQLKKNTPTVIIYFNPDCNHCIQETRNLLDSMAYVNQAQFVFASYAPFGEIKKFDSLFKLFTYPNIKIGRDVRYYIPAYFKVRFTPFIAVYDHKGMLLKAYAGGTSIKKLAAVLKMPDTGVKQKQL
jgi:hypothetical protein